MQVQNLCGRQDAGELDFFEAVFFSHELLKKAVLAPHPNARNSEMMPPRGVADPVDLYHYLFILMGKPIEMITIGIGLTCSDFIETAGGTNDDAPDLNVSSSCADVVRERVKRVYAKSVCP